MRNLLAVASLIVIGGCAASSVSPEQARFNNDLNSGHWISVSYGQMAARGPFDRSTPHQQGGTVALALASPEAVALIFCEPETGRPIAALFTPGQSDWKNRPNDPGFPIRVRADGGKWHTFSGVFLSDNGLETSSVAATSVGVADQEAIRFGDIIGQAKSEVWIDAGGTKHRLLADRQRLVERALDGCRAGFDVPREFGA